MESQKTPLVLIPGLLSNEKVWKHQMQNLDDLAAVKVISSTHEDTPDEMVESILSQAPPEFALAGHSMGGWLSLEIMRRVPERVLKLCLLNTSARIDSPEKLEKRQKMIEAVKRGDFSIVTKQIADVLVYRNSVKQDVLEMFYEIGETSFIDQEKAMILRKDCVQLLSKIRIPTSVIHAEKDLIFSLEVHEELARLIPQAKLHIIPDCGHMSPMESPETVTTILRQWLLS